MKVVSIYDQKSHLTPGPSLNVRQLLNPIFFSPAIRHPNMKRQLSRRQRSKDLAAARALKLACAYVPLCRVDRTVYLRDFYDWVDGRDHWKTVLL